METESRITTIPLAMALVLAVFVVVAVLVEGSSNADDEWKAPASAVTKKNPIPADEQSVALGKEIYVQNCLPCHGISGKGDGPASQALEKRPRNLTDPKFMNGQTDGAFFWKISEGRGPMPQWKDALPEEDLWRVINYIRTLASKK